MADSDSQNLIVISVMLMLLVYTLKSNDGDNTALFVGASIVAAAVVLATAPLAPFFALLMKIPPCVIIVSVAAALTFVAVPVAAYYYLRKRKQHVTPKSFAEEIPPQQRPFNQSRFESSQDADWCYLPGTVMTLILRKLDQDDVCSVRLVSKDWYNSSAECLEHLKPKAFHPAYLMKDFSCLKSLDLSECVEEVTADGMVFLKFLGNLTHVSFGRHHNLIASTINDRCLIQLTALRKLKKLNLAQCVHITDQGLNFLAQALPVLEDVNIGACVNVTDQGIHELAQIGTLRSIEMPWCLKITDMGIEALISQPKLKKLDVSGCQLLTETGISLIAYFPDLESLNLLNTGFSKVCVTDAALERLSGLSKLTHLSIGGVHVQNTRASDAGITTIVNSFPKLQHLCLMWLDISNDAVYALSKMAHLTSLSLRGCARITADAMAHVARMSKLQELNLLNNPWLDMNDEVVDVLTPLRELEKLSLGDMRVGNVLTDNGMASLSSFKKLQTLNLSFFEWQFAGAGLGPLLKMRELESLDLTGSNNVSDSTLQVIGMIQSIKHIQLSKCAKISSNGLKHMTQMKQLQTVSLTGCFRIDDRGLASLSEIPSITCLNLSQCIAVTDHGICQLKKLKKLKTLDLSGVREIRGEGFEGFADVPLGALNLNGCANLQDVGLVHIGKIKALTKLEMCGCTMLTDIGIGALRDLTNLTDVDVSSCAHLGDASMGTLSLLPRLTTLKVNFLNMVTDYGISSLVRLPGLLTAHFDRCQNLTDQSLVHLGNCASLTSLRLARCARITDAGVAFLSKLNQLSILSLAQCPFVTDNGIRSLDALPALASLEY